MKTRLLTLSFWLMFWTSVFSQQITQYPLRYMKGYGQFPPSFAGKGPLSSEDPLWKNARGVYTKLKGVQFYRIILNEPQFYYQQFLTGELSKQKFDQYKLMSSVDSTKLSEEVLKVSYNIVTGQTNSGEAVWIVDSNNDLDFNDEKPHSLMKYNAKQFTQIGNNAINITYETFERGSIKSQIIPLAFCSSEGNTVLYNFPQYAQVKVPAKDQLYEVAVQFNDFTAIEPGGKGDRAVVSNSIGSAEQFELKDIVAIGQYLKLDSAIFQFMGSDESSLFLKKVESILSVESAQIGFQIPQFTAQNFISGQTLESQQFKGKYILLDFYATWCAPCIKEFPNLKALLKEYGTDKFGIIGIVGNSKPDALQKLLADQELTWPQILSDTIVEQYKVNYYPTTFLVDPDGRIIDKNVKGEHLNKVLSELLR